jgi:hypothetical protein
MNSVQEGLDHLNRRNRAMSSPFVKFNNGLANSGLTLSAISENEEVFKKEKAKMVANEKLAPNQNGEFSATQKDQSTRQTLSEKKYNKIKRLLNRKKTSMKIISTKIMFGEDIYYENNAE